MRMLRLFIILLVSFGAAALVCQYKGDKWEGHVRDGMYWLMNDSVPNYSVEQFDSLGIPFVYYPTQNGITPGNLYNATLVCNAALLYYDSLKQENNPVTRQKFFHCINWLIEEMDDRDSLALFVFRWQQSWYPKVKAPFTSGMTSGLAMQAFMAAFQLQPNSAHLDRAAKLLRGYELPIEKGGFTIKEEQGYWFEELADTNKQTPRILDGHIYALLSLRYYDAKFKTYEARYLFKKGLLSLKHYLPKYDAGNGEIFYDAQGKLADKKYKAIITGQLKQLYQLTGDIDILYYYDKWVEPLQKPYVYRIAKEGNRSGLILFALMTMAFFVPIYLLQRLWQRSKRTAGK